MIAPTVLRSIAAARLQDAEVLLAAERYDGAAYICGYAVELSLKARICDTLNWVGYPAEKEFQNLLSFKTHNLEILLHLSGQEARVKQMAPVDWWIIVNNWKPEMRYRAIGAISPSDVHKLLASTTALLRML